MRALQCWWCGALQARRLQKRLWCAVRHYCDAQDTRKTRMTRKIRARQTELCAFLWWKMRLHWRLVRGVHCE